MGYKNMWGNNKMNSIKKILELLPGFNCGACGFTNCYGFAKALVSNKTDLAKCTILSQDRFLKNKQALEENASTKNYSNIKPTTGLIDKANADFLLHPYHGEPSCRETLMCFDSIVLKKNMLIRYRPLGCPITHFGQIIENNKGLIDVWLVGPGKLLGKAEDAIDVGICMVLSFQGTIEGDLPTVGQTVKFLPSHCMMGKVHSGIIVHLENDRARIDCIDLKIWEHAKIN